MKKQTLRLSILLLLPLVFAWFGCSSNYTNPPTYSPMPTSTPVPGSATTITISTATSGSSTTGYIYTSGSGSNGTGGVLNVTAHVGDTVNFTANGTHPLWFDGGSSACIYSGVTSNQSYAVTGTGTFYFHCGNHGSGCSGGNGACGSTNCTAMAGVLTVN